MDTLRRESDDEEAIEIEKHGWFLCEVDSRSCLGKSIVNPNANPKAIPTGFSEVPLVSGNLKGPSINPCRKVVVVGNVPELLSIA